MWTGNKLLNKVGNDNDKALKEKCTMRALKLIYNALVVILKINPMYETGK